MPSGCATQQPDVKVRGCSSSVVFFQLLQLCHEIFVVFGLSVWICHVLGASLRDHGLWKDGQAEMLPASCQVVSCDVSMIFDDF